MSKKSNTTSFIRVKLIGRTGGVDFRDIPIEKQPTQRVAEMQLLETETVETLVQKVVIGDTPELKLVPVEELV